MPTRSKGSQPATKADLDASMRKLDQKIDSTKTELTASMRKLDQKIDSTKTELTASMRKLDQKIDSTKTELTASMRKLDQKIDSSVERLDQKIDSSVERLDQKIDSSVHRLAKMIVNNQMEIREINHSMAGLATKDDINRIMNVLDSFTGKVQNYDRATVLHGHVLVEVETGLKDHEKRITTLESRTLG